MAKPGLPATIGRLLAAALAIAAVCAGDRGAAPAHANPPTNMAVNPHPFDHPDILRFVFHPRPATGADARDRMIPVDGEIRIGARWHPHDPRAATVVFFHGNGEIAAEYDDIAPVYHRMGLNLLVVDYRGYGRSDGRPGVAALLADARAVWDHTLQWCRDNGFDGPLVVMGRSLGSAAALELAAAAPDELAGLIIESGFARSLPLLRRLGVDVDSRQLGLSESGGFDNLDKIRRYHNPLLVIHARQDHIIPFQDARLLYEACPSPRKHLVVIENADHNSLMFHGAQTYFQAIADFVGSLNP